MRQMVTDHPHVTQSYVTGSSPKPISKEQHTNLTVYGCYVLVLVLIVTAPIIIIATTTHHCDCDCNPTATANPIAAMKTNFQSRLPQGFQGFQGLVHVLRPAYQTCHTYMGQSSCVLRNGSETGEIFTFVEASARQCYAIMLCTVLCNPTGPGTLPFLGNPSHAALLPHTSCKLLVYI